MKATHPEGKKCNANSNFSWKHSFVPCVSVNEGGTSRLTAIKAKSRNQLCASAVNFGLIGGREAGDAGHTLVKWTNLRVAVCTAREDRQPVKDVRTNCKERNRHGRGGAGAGGATVHTLSKQTGNAWHTSRPCRSQCGFLLFFPFFWPQSRAVTYLFLWELGGFGCFTAASGALRWRKRLLRQGATSVMSFRLSSKGLPLGDSEDTMSHGLFTFFAFLKSWRQKKRKKKCKICFINTTLVCHWDTEWKLPHLSVNLTEVQLLYSWVFTFSENVFWKLKITSNDQPGICLWKRVGQPTFEITVVAERQIWIFSLLMELKHVNSKFVSLHISEQTSQRAHFENTLEL